MNIYSSVGAAGARVAVEVAAAATAEATNEVVCDSIYVTRIVSFPHFFLLDMFSAAVAHT